MEQQEQLTPEEYAEFLAYGDPEATTELTPEEITLIDSWAEMYSHAEVA
jgi:hypothetical protein